MHGSACVGQRGPTAMMSCKMRGAFEVMQSRWCNLGSAINVVQPMRCTTKKRLCKATQSLAE
eukprot:1547845-Pyramimonas_sp.AAC.1